MRIVPLCLAVVLANSAAAARPGAASKTATDCQEIPGTIAIQSEGGALDYRNIVLIPIEEKK